MGDGFYSSGQLAVATVQIYTFLSVRACQCQ